MAREALDHDEPLSFFQELLEHGCVSGMVNSLIYYRDTHAFFDQHYEEIEALREEFEHDQGVSLDISGDLKNALAWFAFELVAYRLANDLEII